MASGIVQEDGTLVVRGQETEMTAPVFNLNSACGRAEAEVQAQVEQPIQEGDNS